MKCRVSSLLTSAALLHALPALALAQARLDEPLLERPEEFLPADWRWLTNRWIAGNEIWRVLALFLALLLAMVLGRLLKYILSAVAARFRVRGRTLIGVGLEAVARTTGFVAIVVGLTVGLEFLVLHPVVAVAADTVVRILWTIAVGYVAYQLVNVVDEWLRRISEATPSKLDDMLVPLVRKSLRGTILILVLVQIATFLSDKPVTSIIAGLGVGGLAVGLAAQDTIKNFFGSMMIFGDRPFELGDEIIVDTRSGIVETVGFRSTRFRTEDGHLVTFPNGDLASKPIVNVSRRRNMVRRLTLSLQPSAPVAKAQRAVEIIQEILAGHEGLDPSRPPRVFLSEITPAALNVSVTYWYHPADYWKFQRFNEQVNLEILRRFEREEILLVGQPKPAST